MWAPRHHMQSMQTAGMCPKTSFNSICETCLDCCQPLLSAQPRPPFGSHTDSSIQTRSGQFTSNSILLDSFRSIRFPFFNPAKFNSFNSFQLSSVQLWTLTRS